MKKRLGLYGGTFSPPHLGHIRAAEEFISEMALDSLVIMPANIPPHKVMAEGVCAEERLEMCHLAFDHISGATVSDYEIKKSGVSYTYETLEHLSGEDHETFMLCGDDMLLTLDKWRNPERIFELAHIACARRYETDVAPLLEKKREYEEKYGARVTILDSAAYPVSSTEVRESILSGEADSRIPTAVFEYIQKKGLYKEATK